MRNDFHDLLDNKPHPVIAAAICRAVLDPRPAQCLWRRRRQQLASTHCCRHFADQQIAGRYTDAAAGADGTTRSFRLKGWQPLAASDRFEFDASYTPANESSPGRLMLVAAPEANRMELATLPVNTVELSLNGARLPAQYFPSVQGKADPRFVYLFAVPAAATCTAAQLRVTNFQGIALEEQLQLCPGTPSTTRIDRVVNAAQ